MERGRTSWRRPLGTKTIEAEPDEETMMDEPDDEDVDVERR